MTVISNNNIAEAIYLAAKGKEASEQALVLKRAVKILAQKKLLSKAKDILARLTNIINLHQNKVIAKVGSAQKLTEKTKDELKHLLMKRYGAKEVEIVERVEEKLLGGFKIEVRDEVIDLSMKNKVRKLQEHLRESLQ